MEHPLHPLEGKDFTGIGRTLGKINQLNISEPSGKRGLGKDGVKVVKPAYQTESERVFDPEEHPPAKPA